MNLDEAKRSSLLGHYALFLLLGLLGAAALYLLSRTNYLLYHSLIELFAVGVAVSVFTIGWNTRHIVTSNALFLLAVAYGCIAGLDLLHALAYSGMGVFPERGSNLPTQLWLVARLLEALSLFAAALLLGSQRRLSAGWTLAGYGLLTGLFLATIFPGSFPTMYVQGQGLTWGKVAGEYLICALLAGAAVLFWRRRAAFPGGSLKFLLAAIGVTLASELAFTLYTDVYGFFNTLGHLLKLVSVVLIYKALVSDLLLRPYEGFFRDLSRSRNDLEHKEDLLRAERDKLDTLVQLNVEGLMVLDREGMIQFLNPATAKMFRREREELLGEQFGYVLTPDSSEEIELLSDSGETNVVELRTTETEWSGQSAILATFRDITERKHAEEELHKSREELEAIYENAPLVMLLLDSTHCVRKANRYSSEFIGLSEESLHGRHVGEVLSCVQHVNHQNACGSGSQCEECTFRNTITETFQSGESFNQVETTLTLIRNAEEGMFTFLVSSMPLQQQGEPMALLALVDITERKEAEEGLRRMSFSDSLTGLYNRNFFEEEMNRLSDGRHSPIGIIIFDVDGLKSINDTLGHESGDHILSSLAEILKDNLRSSDIIARIGGDEFAVLLPDIDEEGMQSIMDRVRGSVEQFNSASDQRIFMSVSMGRAVSGPGNPDMQALFREADNLMYREKVERDESSRRVDG